mmetsp:Transcript_8203/g.11718  ORF Transcript_8203/g.11718 Transcript_8203/m.11718 type:complete len:427 (+) Transcript_8203:164-1444(+)
MAKKKVLLMGKAQAGKTSMRSIIFANYLARDTMRLSATLDVEHHHVRFLGDLVLNLWDCGGQDAFYESYFERDRETIFRSVELLIYVFDIESDCPEKDFDHFAGVLEAIEENSPDARIFVLVHKMDLVAEEERELILDDRRRLIEDSCATCGVHNFHCFGTSIWDETLYKAWSEIVTNLIPNIGVLESHLDDFCRICDADEVVLFERATFLVISHSHAYKGSNDTTIEHNAGMIDSNGDRGSGAATTGGKCQQLPADNDPTEVISTSSSTAHGQDLVHLNVTTGNSIDGAALNNDDHQQAPSMYSESSGGKEETRETISAMGNENQPMAQGQNSQDVQRKNSPHFDAHRFEKISNIVKQFKLSCGKAQSQFQGMEVRNSRFSAFIDAFTANTYIMVIVSNPNVHTAATLVNIKNARRHFERFIPRS